MTDLHRLLEIEQHVLPSGSKVIISRDRADNASELARINARIRAESLDLEVRMRAFADELAVLSAAATVDIRDLRTDPAIAITAHRIQAGIDAMSHVTEAANLWGSAKAQIVRAVLESFVWQTPAEPGYDAIREVNLHRGER